MDNKTARDKAERIVKRLERGEGVDPQIHPTKLLLFGSTLKKKEKPGDLDLILEYERTDVFDSSENVRAIMGQGMKFSAIYRTIRDIKKGMRKIDIVPVLNGDYEKENILELSPTEVIWEAS